MMSVDVHVVLRQVNIGAAYLWDPSDSSWIARIASAFYALSIVIASPVILLVALVSSRYYADTLSCGSVRRRTDGVSVSPLGFYQLCHRSYPGHRKRPSHVLETPRLFVSRARGRLSRLCHQGQRSKANCDSDSISLTGCRDTPSGLFHDSWCWKSQVGGRWSL